MLRARGSWVGFSTRFKFYRTRSFCTRNNNNSESMESSVSHYNKTYKQLDNLDFMSAAKILFTDPPKTKKFGFDFHLVQFFFACMPSLAVYLVAQYARREMRKMDAELEEKKKKEEEKGKEEEQLKKALEEKEKTESHPDLEEVKVRLDKLEDTIKEIVVESKKQSGGTVTKNHEEDTSVEKQIAAKEPKETKDDKSELGKERVSDKKDAEEKPVLNQGKVSSSVPVSNDH